MVTLRQIEGSIVYSIEWISSLCSTSSVAFGQVTLSSEGYKRCLLAPGENIGLTVPNSSPPLTHSHHDLSTQCTPFQSSSLALSLVSHRLPRRPSVQPRCPLLFLVPVSHPSHFDGCLPSLPVANPVNSAADIKVTAVVTNTGTEALRLLKTNSILDTTPSKSFDVTKGGTPVNFIGVKVCPLLHFFFDEF